MSWKPYCHELALSWCRDEVQVRRTIVEKYLLYRHPSWRGVTGEKRSKMGDYETEECIVHCGEIEQRKPKTRLHEALKESPNLRARFWDWFEIADKFQVKILWCLSLTDPIFHFLRGRLKKGGLGQLVHHFVKSLFVTTITIDVSIFLLSIVGGRFLLSVAPILIYTILRP